MCKKSTLYEAGTANVGKLRKRSKGGKLNFQQVSYSTDCVREFANIREIPMYVAIQQLQTAEVLEKIYRAARSSSPATAKTLARTIALKMM